MNSTHASRHDGRQQFYMVQNYFIHRATGREQHIKSVIHLLKTSCVGFFGCFFFFFLPHMVSK